MRVTRAISIVAVATTALLCASGAATADTPFDRAFRHYETIRSALLFDTIEGVPDAARAVHEVVATSEPGMHDAVPGDRREEAGRLFADAAVAAEDLANAENLDAAREAFAKLSEALIRYRQLLPAPEPVVVFCPMAKKAWLQPDGEIGNPYYGQSMARCGEIVSDARDR